MRQCLVGMVWVVSLVLGSCSPDVGGSLQNSEKIATCDVKGWQDQDGDGISDKQEGGGVVDTDGDGRMDSRDDDSDNDGFADHLEAGPKSCEGILSDVDYDGIPDFRDLDADDNGIPDRDDGATDIDGDGYPDWRDLDDDNDRIPDAVEIGPDPADPADSDNDGFFDYQDSDADDDGIPDRDEGAHDIDGDGLASYRDDDSDGDGWKDSLECPQQEDGEDAEGEANPWRNLRDTDEDGAPDCYDLDSDNDRLPDADERNAGTSRVHADTDGDGFNDRHELDSSTNPLEATDFPEPDPCAPNECGLVELCGDLGSGDGLDNDCNGHVDEICSCSSGERRPCFLGPPSRRGQGACSDGLELCSEFNTWGACFGGVWPEEERCDGADNDCDGLYDEDLEGCISPLTCSGTLNASPLSTIELIGDDIYSGDYDSWSWELFCPPTVDSCPLPDAPDERNTSVYVVSSGNYRVRATISIDGEVHTCQYPIDVQGDGLRVELLWDTQGVGRGDTDVDLHLHRPNVTTDWFDSSDDCYYVNCKATRWTGGSGPEWDLPPTLDLSACNEAPHGHGAQWEEVGYCANPRLDVDVISCHPDTTSAESRSFCAPENINIDAPVLGDMYRIMVDYFSSKGYQEDTHPTVNVYCGGALRATLGGGEIALQRTGQRWVAADVVFREDSCGGIDCTVLPIFRGVDTPWIQDDTEFGPPW